MKKLSLKELGRVSNEAFKAMPKTPLVLVLDNVRSALNVGSAFRTADAFALEQILLCGITARPPHKEILKTAIGATASMEWQYEEEVTKAVKQLKEKGYKVIGVEQTNESISLQNFTPDAGSKYALVFGNEVDGLSDSILELLDGCVEVPQFGTKHSLNVAVCLGIVTWDVVKKIKF